MIVGVSVKMNMCTHPGVIGGMCILCGQLVDDESGVSFGYIHKVFVGYCDGLVLAKLLSSTICLIFYLGTPFLFSYITI